MMQALRLEGSGLEDRLEAAKAESDALVAREAECQSVSADEEPRIKCVFLCTAASRWRGCCVRGGAPCVPGVYHTLSLVRAPWFL
jgi:hypothetical protein